MVPGFDWNDLFRTHGVVSIGHLITDTEGLDCTLLQRFPFDRLKPLLITFEHCHCDPVTTQTNDVVTSVGGERIYGLGPQPVLEATEALLQSLGYAKLAPYDGGPPGLYFDGLNHNYYLMSASR